MPSMQVGREKSSSCSLDGYLFAFCGYNANQGQLKSIEKLRVVRSASEQNQESWQLIPVANIASSLTPRESVVACPLNETKILIMGGYEGRSVYKNDAFLFDTRSEHVELVLPQEEAELSGFVSKNNASTVFSQKKVVAIVQGPPEQSRRKSYLVEYEFGYESVKVKSPFM